MIHSNNHFVVLGLNTFWSILLAYKWILPLVFIFAKMNVKEMIGGCIVCGEEQISDENSLIYCDGPCGHGFHQGI